MKNNEYTKEQLDQLIKELFGITQITPTIQKQIANYVLAYDMSFKEIARCLVYYVEVEHGQLKPQYGIAIVLSVREHADKYFKKLELDQQKQKQESEKIKEYQENNVVFHIGALPETKRKAKQFDISEINVDIEGDDK